MLSFFPVAHSKKDTIFIAARKIFGPTYFVTASVPLLEKFYFVMTYLNM